MTQSVFNGCKRACLWLMLATITTSLMLAGCERQEEADVYFNPPEESSLRIVSLAPALTQILKDLDQLDLVVGVSQNDAVAPASAKVVGTYLDINAEALASVSPTLVLTMAGEDGPPARLAELAKQQGFMLVSYPFPQSTNDVGDIIIREAELLSVPLPPEMMDQQPKQPSIGALLDLLPQASNLKMTMMFRLAELSRITRNEGSPMTLLVIGTQPVMASGPGTVLDQLLAMAGGRNAAYEATVGAPTFDREKLTALSPDVILYFDPTGHELGPIDVEPRLAEFRGLDIPAVRNSRIVLVSSPDAMLPSSTLDRTAGMMAKALHPELVDKIDWVLQASRAELIRKNDIDAATTAPAPAIIPTRPDAPVPATPDAGE